MDENEKELFRYLELDQGLERIYWETFFDVEKEQDCE